MSFINITSDGMYLGGNKMPISAPKNAIPFSHNGFLYSCKKVPINKPKNIFKISSIQTCYCLKFVDIIAAKEDHGIWLCTSKNIWENNIESIWYNINGEYKRVIEVYILIQGSWRKSESKNTSAQIIEKPALKQVWKLEDLISWH